VTERQPLLVRKKYNLAKDFSEASAEDIFEKRRLNGKLLTKQII
jgi:hypothetical protein